MKRRFRQKHNVAPKNDPEKDEGKSNDGTQENVSIDDVIEEINTLLKTTQDAPEEKEL